MHNIAFSVVRNRVTAPIARVALVTGVALMAGAVAVPGMVPVAEAAPVAEAVAGGVPVAAGVPVEASLATSTVMGSSGGFTTHRELSLAMPGQTAGENPEDKIHAITGVNPGALDSNTISPATKGSLQVRLTRKNPNDDPLHQNLPSGSTQNYTVKLFQVSGISPLGADYLELGKMTLTQARRQGLTQVQSLQTDAQGVVEFKDLSLGMYVVESTAPTTPVRDYLKFYPQLLVLPYADVDGQGSPGWSYVMGVAPKPHVAVVSKPASGGGSGGSVPASPSPTPTKSASPSATTKFTPDPTPSAAAAPLDPRVLAEQERARRAREALLRSLAATGVWVGAPLALSVALVVGGVVVLRRRRKSSS